MLSFFRAGFSFVLLIIASACTDLKQEDCQDVGSFSFYSKENCKSQVYPLNEYDELGLLKSVNPSVLGSYKIMMLGGSEVSGEELPQSMRLPSLLESSLYEETKKHVTVINAGIANSSTTHVRQIYSKLLERHSPNLVLYILPTAIPISRDFLEIDSLSSICPFFKIFRINFGFSVENILQKTSENFVDMHRMSKAKNVKFAVIPAFAYIRQDSFLKWLSGCQSFIAIDPEKAIKAEEVVLDFLKKDIPLIAPALFAVVRYESIKASDPPLEQSKAAKQNFMKTLVPWLIPYIFEDPIISK